MFARTLPALASVLLASASAAQAPESSATPHRRAHHALVYDEARRVVLLAGGSTPLDSGRRFVFFNDVWAFDGARWRFVDTSGAEMSGFRLVFEPRAGRIVSFGGFTGRATGDLRVLEGGRWRTLATHPELTAAEPGFVYDSRRSRFVLFGGGPLRVGDAGWLLDGDRWTRIAASGPPPREAHAMAYDERRDRVVVFGGLAGRAPGGSGPPPTLGDTWEFDGARWEQRTADGPSPRASPGIAYDTKRGLTILFGGMGAAGMLSDTWSWDGSAWKRLAESGPEARAMGYLAYDRHRDRIVLFGGRRAGWPNGDANDTWEWDGARWSRVETGSR